MISPRTSARRLIAAIGIAFAGLAITLNHFMLSGDVRMARAAFYLLVCALPVTVIIGWRCFAREYRGESPDDLREWSIPVLWGLGGSSCIWLISLAY